jgi:hypothetical protein
MFGVEAHMGLERFALRYVQVYRVLVPAGSLYVLLQPFVDPENPTTLGVKALRVACLPGVPSVVVSTETLIVTGMVRPCYLPRARCH